MQKINTQLIDSVQVTNIDMQDYPDFVDAFITYAEWKDSGLPLSDEELEVLNQDSAFVYDEVMNALY